MAIRTLPCAFGLGFQLLESWRIDDLPIPTRVPRPASVGFATIPGAGGVVKILIYESWRRRDAANRESIDAHTFEGRSEYFHVGDFAGHQELQSADRAGIIRETDKTLVNNLGACFSSDVAAKVDVKFARDFKVVGCPSIAHGIVKSDAATPGDSDEGSISAAVRLFFIGRR